MPGNTTAGLLYLASDAFGGIGGIARFNRDFATALALHPAVGSVNILPRRVPATPEPLPACVRQAHAPRFGKIGYSLKAVQQTLAGNPDLIICGHVNLLPLAALVKHLARRPVRLVLVIHGIDVWTPLQDFPDTGLIDQVVSVSRFTLEAFQSWSGFPAGQCSVLPNTIDLGRFSPGPRPGPLAERLGLGDADVVMGMGRLDATERQKGFDEMLAALPQLIQRRPRLKYLICGDGTDRPRLEAKARHLGLADRVVFAGYVPEAEKVDHYRLADAFVLCGWQEGFGIVLLEAMGCGVPVVASRADGSREAVLDGMLGELADPGDVADLVAAVDRALARPHPFVPPGLADSFGQETFQGRTMALLDTWLER